MGAYSEPLQAFGKVDVYGRRSEVRLYGNRVEDEHRGLFGTIVHKLYLSDVAEADRDGARRVTLITRERTARAYAFRTDADCEVFLTMLDGLL